MRILINLFGVLCFSLAIFLGLFAMVGYFSSDDTFGRVMAGVVATVALIVLGIGVRAIRRPQRPMQRREKREAQQIVGLQFDDFCWGEPAPTRNQFAYAILLGASVRNGFTKAMMSEAIDEAKAVNERREPARKDQLRLIKEYHGVLPHAVTRAEADRIIEFLEEHFLPCPFCGMEVCAVDDVCCECMKSLRPMRIPIEL